VARCVSFEKWTAHHVSGAKEKDVKATKGLYIVKANLETFPRLKALLTSSLALRKVNRKEV
jgi:hypothetical protein